jgi:hypothetical protein
MCYCYTTEVFFSFCLPARLMIVFHLPEHDLPCTVLARCSFPEKNINGLYSPVHNVRSSSRCGIPPV